MTALVIKASRGTVSRVSGRSAAAQPRRIGAYVIAARCDMTPHGRPRPRSSARCGCGADVAYRLRRQPTFVPRTRDFPPWAASLTPCRHEDVCTANSELDRTQCRGRPRSHAGKAGKPDSRNVEYRDPAPDPDNADQEIAPAGDLFDRAAARAAAAPARRRLPASPGPAGMRGMCQKTWFPGAFGPCTYPPLQSTVGWP